MTSQDHIDFFWRPGCPFCTGLEQRLSDSDVPFQKLNIWEDPDHAAFVRSVADGNEVVPTVRIGDVSLVNPSVQQVLAAMETEVPHLVPSSG